jgi:molecular chaperone GrpE
MNAEPDRSHEDEAASSDTEMTAEVVEPFDAEGETAAAAGQGASEDPLAELQAKADENWDKYLRAAAELENIRKRAERDVANAHKFALERFATDLLAVCDSLEMAQVAEKDASIESLMEGNEATLKLLGTVLRRFGIEELDPQGEPFDPNLHEAMTMQPSDTVEPGSVLNVFQKGYALNGRLLRPARVVVASEPAETGKKR